MIQNALLYLALAGTMVLSAQTNPAAPKGSARAARYVEAEPINFNDHVGWTSMFDGTTLKGWDGAPDQWKVENGSITVSSSAEKPLGSMYMYWTGGQPGNFEFKTEIKLEGIAANSGIQFRAKRLGPVVDKKYSQWESRGYQADLDNQNSNTGALIECCAGPRRASRPAPIEPIAAKSSAQLCPQAKNPPCSQRSVTQGNWPNTINPANGTSFI